MELGRALVSLSFEEWLDLVFRHEDPNYPRETEAMIDRFLGGPQPISAALRQYAQAARTGCMN